MSGLADYWRLYRSLWHIECSEQSVLFREQQRLSPYVYLVLYLGAVAVILIMGLPGALGLLSTEDRGPVAWSTLLIGANVLALLLTAYAYLTVRRTIIRVDPLHLHVGWRGIYLHGVTKWQRLEGVLVRKWRRKLVRPMGVGALSLGLWAARGNISNVFCPVGMRTALLIELEGRRGPEYVLIGTRKPVEFEAALGQATSKPGRRQPDYGDLDNWMR